MNYHSSLSHQVAPQIDFQISRSNDRRFGCIHRVQPTKHSSHTGHELAKTDRLGDIVVGTGIQRPYHVVLRVAHRNHQDPDFGSKGANFSAGFHSADSWHIDVEKHQIKGMLGKNLNRLFSAARLHNHEAVGSERRAKHLAQGWFVIYDQHMNWER